MPPFSTTGPGLDATLLPDSASSKTIGTPVPGWEDIPIMPGAYNAELEDMVYLYSVDVPMEQVEEYYLAKMDVNGWALTDRQSMDASPTGGASTVLDFQRDERLVNVMLVHVAQENNTAVILSVLGQ